MKDRYCVRDVQVKSMPHMYEAKALEFVRVLHAMF